MKNIVFFVAAIFAISHAQTLTCTLQNNVTTTCSGTSNCLWETPSLWAADCAGYPQNSSYSATVNLEGSYTLTIDQPTTVGSINVGANNANTTIEIHVTSTNFVVETFTIGENAIVELNLPAGSVFGGITNTSTWIVNGGTLAWNSGTFNTLQPSANDSSISVAETGTLVINSGTKVCNQNINSVGTFRATSGANINNNTAQIYSRGNTEFDGSFNVTGGWLLFNNAVYKGETTSNILMNAVDVSFIGSDLSVIGVGTFDVDAQFIKVENWNVTTSTVTFTAPNAAVETLYNSGTFSFDVQNLGIQAITNYHTMNCNTSSIYGLSDTNTLTTYGALNLNNVTFTEVETFVNTAGEVFLTGNNTFHRLYLNGGAVKAANGPASLMITNYFEWNNGTIDPTLSFFTGSSVNVAIKAPFFWTANYTFGSANSIEFDNDVTLQDDVSILPLSNATFNGAKLVGGAGLTLPELINYGTITGGTIDVTNVNMTSFGALWLSMNFANSLLELKVTNDFTSTAVFTVQPGYNLTQWTFVNTTVIISGDLVIDVSGDAEASWTKDQADTFDLIVLGPNATLQGNWSSIRTQVPDGFTCEDATVQIQDNAVKVSVQCATPKKKRPNVGLIVGLSVGGAALLAIVIGFFVWRKRRQDHMGEKTTLLSTENTRY